MKNAKEGKRRQATAHSGKDTQPPRWAKQPPHPAKGDLPSANKHYRGVSSQTTTSRQPIKQFLTANLDFEVQQNPKT
jgi:hypothetical protein